MSHSDEKILIAFDGSEASVRAIEQTAHLLGTDRTAIILTVWEPGMLSSRSLPTGGDMESPVPLPDGKEVGYGIQAEREHAQRLSEVGVSLAQDQGLNALSRISHGSLSVAAAIAESVSKEKVCMLAIGAHRHGALSSALLGSTVQNLLHELDTPMLVVRP